MRTILFLSLFVSSLFAEEQNQPLLLPWSSNFETSLATAQANSLPIYLFATGSTWCVWCKKMDREIHSQDVFRQKLIGKIVFVKIDLPASSKPSDETEALLHKYHIEGVPTVLILSPQGDEIGRFGYRNMSPNDYADLVLSSIQSFQEKHETPETEAQAPEKKE